MSTKIPVNAARLCGEILDLDEGIRFAGIATKFGKVVASIYREGLDPLLTRQESELSVTQSIIRMGTRQTLEQKLGKTVYAFAMYEKVKRATIPMRDPESHILMVSFDNRSDHERLILEKIIPLVREQTAP
ncbi:hypothetical protein [Nitrososphaera sp.]|uniref:hypothetical protein n=1 Tax=Nitrososphaera sp. TaxID=1971748 RepID=UPI0017FD1BDF|nr:hypothetical protein [Nitrososphaera sp.]NWG37911.1 hypothetical protein [Nitrososphaera sp.]